MGLWEKAGSKKAEVVPLWDAFIHFMGIKGQCGIFPPPPPSVASVRFFHRNQGELPGIFRRIVAPSELTAGGGRANINLS